jgi:hypothetical protein
MASRLTRLHIVSMTGFRRPSRTGFRRSPPRFSLTSSSARQSFNTRRKRGTRPRARPSEAGRAFVLEFGSDFAHHLERINPRTARFWSAI